MSHAVPARSLPVSTSFPACVLAAREVGCWEGLRAPSAFVLLLPSLGGSANIGA